MTSGVSMLGCNQMTIQRKLRNRLKKLLLTMLLCAFLAFSGCQFLELEFSSLSIPQEDTLVLFNSGPLTLDPAISQEASSHMYIMQIFSGLVAFDEDMNLVPDIAERWEPNEAGNTYTFYLREGVKFHNGDEVTARDFKYSWERACSPETGSPTAVTYLNDIVGVEEMLSGEADEIKGIKVLNDYTLQVSIDSPKSYFLAKLTYPVAFVVDKSNIESGDGWWREPEGTGPFKLKGWEEDELLLLERNDLYYRDKAGVSHVAFRLIQGPVGHERRVNHVFADVASKDGQVLDIHDAVAPSHRANVTQGAIRTPVFCHDQHVPAIDFAVTAEVPSQLELQRIPLRA